MNAYMSRILAKENLTLDGLIADASRMFEDHVAEAAKHARLARDLAQSIKFFQKMKAQEDQETSK